MSLFIKSALISVKIVAAAALLGVAYGLIAGSAPAHTYAVNANLAVGVVILISGLIRLITPASFLVKKGPLVDHTTYGEKFREVGERKQRQAYELIYIGIVGISVTAVAQLLLHLVL